ncbi:MAG TPA: hypothetical protein PLI95_12845 [Polyangiaceae bacterium]|mgnify:CR=1 FL=1|nr:hypothetical protein [Polyangiaceae bacterium]
MNPQRNGDETGRGAYTSLQSGQAGPARNTGAGAESLAPTAMASEPPPPEFTAPAPVPWGKHLLAATTAITAVAIVGATVLMYGVRKAPRLRSLMDSEPVSALAAPGELAQAVGLESLPLLQPFDLIIADQATNQAEPAAIECLAKLKRPYDMRVQITVATTGVVSAVDVQEPRKLTDVQRDCVERAYLSVRIAAFSGSDTRFVKTFDVR